MNVNDVEQDGWYTVYCGHGRFTLPVRYQDLVLIGQGAYGIVVRATDTTTGKYVAIKKILRPFETDIHAKRTYRELKLLMYLNHPDAQVVQLYNVFTPEQNVNEFRTIYLVLNFVGHDLNKLLLQRVPLTETLIQLIICSLLRGLKFIHSAGILHRDLKPTNIGIDRNSNVTILDFGLASVASICPATTYVCTRWWRAPEIYLNEKKYNEKIDIWSVGCIMAELILHKPLFPGQTKFDQLNKIFDIIGTPDLATLSEICTSGYFMRKILETSTYMSQMEPRPKTNFNELFGYQIDPSTGRTISGVSPEGVDLLDQLLSFDPRQRPTAEQALSHPFLEFYHDPDDEPTIEPMINEHQNAEYTKEQWKAIVWQMVEEFIPPSWIDNDAIDDS
ncbi:unnamed protein product [Rotaria sordida]|uniref:mitogen-activated protein kinase n=1 Tax=Rotaria sordida TaxID=392033 RepID=A0A813Q4D1_9BILA|nr:unnamed protein product [Rotaria sordida]CAF0761762.1 unnamed protein product [Rotaria sordida]